MKADCKSCFLIEKWSWPFILEAFKEFWSCNIDKNILSQNKIKQKTEIKSKNSVKPLLRNLVHLVRNIKFYYWKATWFNEWKVLVGTTDSRQKVGPLGRKYELSVFG